MWLSWEFLFCAEWEGGCYCLYRKSAFIVHGSNSMCITWSCHSKIPSFYTLGTRFWLPLAPQKYFSFYLSCWVLFYLNVTSRTFIGSDKLGPYNGTHQELYFLLKTEVHSAFMECILLRTSGRRTNIVKIFSRILCGPNAQASTLTAACHSSLVNCLLALHGHIRFLLQDCAWWWWAGQEHLVTLPLTSVLHGLDTRIVVRTQLLSFFVQTWSGRAHLEMWVFHYLLLAFVPHSSQHLLKSIWNVIRGLGGWMGGSWFWNRENFVDLHSLGSGAPEFGAVWGHRYLGVGLGLGSFVCTGGRTQALNRKMGNHAPLHIFLSLVPY